jgi:proline iminopeptidase
MSGPAVTTRAIELEGFEVLVREAGPGAAPPLLCLHGGPGMDSTYFFPDPEVWGPGLAALAGELRVIAYDQRGCGGSGVPPVDQPLALSHHVDDIERMRVALGLDRPAILAHSFGTVLAILHALRYPESSSSLILIGCAPTRAFQEGYRRSVAEGLPPEAQARLAAIQGAPLTDESMRERFELALPLYFHHPPPEERRRWIVDHVGFSARVNRSIALDLEAYDLTPALPHIRQPALVVYGESDRVVRPEFQLELRGRLRAARFVAFLESGHFPFLEEPEPFARVVHYFLRHGSARTEAP